MKKIQRIFFLAILATIITANNGLAASAVAVGPYNIFGYSYGDSSVLMAKINAKEDCSSRGKGISCRIVNKCSDAGYGTIVKRSDRKIGASCGKSSESLAIEEAKSSAGCAQNNCIIVKEWNDLTGGGI